MGSIQSSINSGINTIVLTGALCRINESVKQAGFKDIDHLELAINNLKVKIAEAEDDGKPVKKKKELLRNYIKIKNDYYKALEEEKERKKKKDLVTSMIIIGVVLILFVTFCIGTMFLIPFQCEEGHDSRFITIQSRRFNLSNNYYIINYYCSSCKKCYTISGNMLYRIF